MKKTRDDGTTYDVAMYARAKDGRIVRGSSTQTYEVISTDDYDIDSPSDAEAEYAKELFGDTEVEFFEEEA